jgi:hypothetical protein
MCFTSLNMHRCVSMYHGGHCVEGEEGDCYKWIFAQLPSKVNVSHSPVQAVRGMWLSLASTPGARKHSCFLLLAALLNGATGSPSVVLVSWGMSVGVLGSFMQLSY